MEEKALKNSIEPGIELLPVIGKCSGTVQVQMKVIGRISVEKSKFFCTLKQKKQKSIRMLESNFFDTGRYQLPYETLTIIIFTRLWLAE